MVSIIDLEKNVLIHIYIIYNLLKLYLSTELIGNVRSKILLYVIN